MRTLLAVLRLTVFIIGSVFVLTPIIILHALTNSIKPAKWWHRWACLVFNIQVRQIGVRLDKGDKPTVFLANHMSYLDILAMGAHLNGRFVAKSEIEQWPIFGFLADLQNTVYVVRKRSAMNESRNAVTNVLAGGENVILFGEGTSSDGRTVLPFKAGLLEPLFAPDVQGRLQPVAIVLEEIDGKTPDNQELRDAYSWWRPETELAPHIWAFAHFTGVKLSIHYLPPLDPARFADRKALALAAYEVVRPVVEAGPANR